MVRYSQKPCYTSGMNETINEVVADGTVNVLSKYCPSNSVLDMVAGKWSVLVLYALRQGVRRYSELERMIDGISQKMLTQTLRELERNGLVQRTVYPVVPPHTEYQLTPLGVSLDDIVYRMGQWAQMNMWAVLNARSAYDQGQR